MPRSPRRQCRAAGCTEVTRDGYCAKHKQRRRSNSDRRRGSAHARGYGRAWRELALAVFRRDKWICQRCARATESGRDADPRARAHCDHIVPKSQGGKDVLENLQTLCGSCHSRKTTTEDGGGWGGRQRRISGEISPKSGQISAV